MNSSPIHILMTGAGAPGAPGILSCLRQDPSIKITLADADAEAVGRFLHPDFIRIPPADDSGFIESMVGHCRERKIQLLLPLVTKELLLLANARERFASIGTKVMVSTGEAIALANDKSRAYRFLLQKKIALPRFHVVRTIEEFVHAAFDLGHPVEPFCFKPSLSNGSRGVRIVSDSFDESDQLFHHKPWQIQISYAHALSILSAKPFPELLVSQFLPGTEYSVDCLADEGHTLLAIPRSREKMINGISVKGSFVNDNDIIEYCTQIIKAAGLDGNIGIQVKRSAAGDPLLLEINPRLQGSTVAAMGAGVNFPVLGVKHALGVAINPEELEVQWGKRFSRYWTEVFY